MVKKFILIDFIDNSSNKLLNKIDELNLKINEVPIFEQRRFLNQISEKYTLSHTTSAKENVLRQKFETLVNCLLNNESNSNISKKKVHRILLKMIKIKHTTHRVMQFV